MTAQSIPVGPGGIPQPPAGSLVHQRGAAPPAPAPAPFNPAPVPTFEQAPAPAEPQSPAQSTSELASLLAALKGAQAPAQPTAAPVPATPPAALEAGQDPVIHAFKSVITGNGLDYDRALGRAIAEGDATLIDFAYIAEAGGANAANLRSAAEAVVARQDEIDTRLEQTVYTKFGSESNWDAAVSFFAKSVPKSTVDYMVGMLKTRNPALIEQASNMVMDHVRQAGAHLDPAGLLNGQSGAVGVAPLDKDGFKQAISKLNPNDRGFEDARKELFIRRHQGKQQGM